MSVSENSERPELPEHLRAVLEQATWNMHVKALAAFTEEGRVDWPTRLKASREICDYMGLTALVASISTNGEMRPPPEWPEADIVPVGGGPGFIACQVRTVYRGQMLIHKCGIQRPVGRKKMAPELGESKIGEALDRGKWLLRKQIAAMG